MDEKRIRLMHVIGGGEFFGRQLPIGGAAEYLFLTLRALDPSTHEHVLVFFYDGPSAAAARERGYKVHILGKRFRKDPSLPFRLARVMRREKIDIVSTHLTDADLCGRVAAALGGTRSVVSTMHSFICGTTAARHARNRKEAFIWWHETRLSFLSKRVITVCDALAEEMASRGVDRKRLVTIPPGVEPERFSADGSHFRTEFSMPRDATVVGTVGRLASAKNYPAFLDLAARLVKDSPNARFVIVGDGPDGNSLKRKAEALKLGDRIIFTGWRDDINRILPAFDIFLLTSSTEAMPITILESMACGRTVVAPAVGGIPEAVRNGETGWVYPAGDMEQAYKVVKNLLDDPQRCHTMGACAVNSVRSRFSLEVMGRKTAELYRDVLG
jgi:glycosyltransferase involved in cell wall biosynthesis